MKKAIATPVLNPLATDGQTDRQTEMSGVELSFFEKSDSNPRSKPPGDRRTDRQTDRNVRGRAIVF